MTCLSVSQQGSCQVLSCFSKTSSLNIYSVTVLQTFLGFCMIMQSTRPLQITHTVFTYLRCIQKVSLRKYLILQGGVSYWQASVAVYLTGCHLLSAKASLGPVAETHTQDCTIMVSWDIRVLSIATASKWGKSNLLVIKPHPLTLQHLLYLYAVDPSAGKLPNVHTINLKIHHLAVLLSLHQNSKNCRCHDIL